MLGHHISFGTICQFFLMVLTLVGATFGSPLTNLLISFTQSKILLMGVLDQSLFIITKDSPLLVYEIPMARYVNGRIDLYGVVPVELATKWPMLYGDANFTKYVLNGGAQVFPFSIGTDKQESLVFAFDTASANHILKSVTLTLKPQPSVAYQELQIVDGIPFDEANLISSDEMNVFFNLNIVRDKMYQLFKYVKNADGFIAEVAFDLCTRKIANGSDVILFAPIDYHECAYVYYNLANGGFVYQNRFHLFTKEQVYIFEYPRASNETVLRVVNIEDFLVTVYVTVTGPDFISSTPDNQSPVIAIVVIVVTLVVFVICGSVFGYFCSPKSDQAPKDESNKNAPTTATSVPQPKDGGTSAPVVVVDSSKANPIGQLNSLKLKSLAGYKKSCNNRELNSSNSKHLYKVGPKKSCNSRGRLSLERQTRERQTREQQTREQQTRSSSAFKPNNLFRMSKTKQSVKQSNSMRKVQSPEFNSKAVRINKQKQAADDDGRRSNSRVKAKGMSTKRRLSISKMAKKIKFKVKRKTH